MSRYIPISAYLPTPLAKPINRTKWLCLASVTGYQSIYKCPVGRFPPVYRCTMLESGRFLLEKARVGIYSPGACANQETILLQGSKTPRGRFSDRGQNVMCHDEMLQSETLKPIQPPHAARCKVDGLIQLVCWLSLCYRGVVLW